MKRILELARNRRSIRRFSREPVPLQDIRYLLEVARNAPSGANRQPWRFLIIGEGEKKDAIRRICEEVEREFHERVSEDLRRWFRERGITWRKQFLSEAPILILVFGKRGEPYWIESVWLAIGYLILAAEELGYSTLTYTPSKLRWANEMFKVPEEFILQAIIPVGKPSEAPESPGRYSLEEIAYMENWGEGFNP